MKFQENYKEVYILASSRQKTLQTNLKTDSFKLSRMRRTKKNKNKKIRKANRAYGTNEISSSIAIYVLWELKREKEIQKIL